MKTTFPSIKVFMCDRHFAQRKAIKDAFGESASVFHCCLHLARNIKSNCGPNTDLLSKLWEMRCRRTKESEDAFVATLERLHESRRSLFTTELLNFLPSFVPSAVDPVLKKELFPALTALREFVDYHPGFNTTTNCFVKSLVQQLIQIGRVEVDIFVHDNTNVIEGYFNGIKSRMNKRPLALHDVYDAVDMTERTVLASGTPFSPKIPQPLLDCLILIVTPNVLNILSLIGVQNVLSLIVTVCIAMLAEKPTVFNAFEMTIFSAITSGSKVETFKWMPEEWLASLETRQAEHEIEHIDVENENCGFDVLMRLQPFLEIAHRSIEVFSALNNTLMTLYSLVGKS